MFEIILQNHDVKILKVLDSKTFQVATPYIKNGVAGQEIELVHFKLIEELLIWLGY